MSEAKNKHDAAEANRLLAGAAKVVANARSCWLATAVAPGAATPASSAPEGVAGATHSPIRHVIVIIGENRSFDHVFATYAPVHGESVWNLLSQGIVRADGKPGPQFARARQQAAADPAADVFLLSPPKAQFPGNVMPAPLVGLVFFAFVFMGVSCPCGAEKGFKRYKVTSLKRSIALAAFATVVSMARLHRFEAASVTTRTFRFMPASSRAMRSAVRWPSSIWITIVVGNW